MGGSIGKMMGDMKASPPSGNAEDSSGTALKQLESVPPPESPYKHVLLDPAPTIGAVGCDRDYGYRCPQFFHAVGDVRGDGREYCAPSEKYGGACTKVYAFEGMSVERRERWADQCQAFWPCKRCRRDYTGCPTGWERSKGTLSCTPTESYDGACGETDFTGYTRAMHDSWSSSCGAFWECAAAAGI